MPEITAAAVKALRDQTGLPMMDCKRALAEAGGDAEKAVELLRKSGKKTMEKRAGRETAAGRIFVYTSLDPGVGAMVELRCESAPWPRTRSSSASAMTSCGSWRPGPGRPRRTSCLAQPSPGKPGRTLRDEFDDLTNRIREVFRVARLVRIDGPSGGYAHHDGSAGVLLEIQGGNAELAKDISMHVAAMRPKVVSAADLDPAAVEKEREILTERARNDGKPEKIVPKIVEGGLKDFRAQSCLAEQIHANRDKYQGQTISQLAAAAGMNLVRFVHWELGKE